MNYHIGLDIGSISLNTVLLDESRNIIESHYTYCHGRPFHVLKDSLSQVFDRHAGDTLVSIAMTGTGGKLAAKLIGGSFINEIVAQSASVASMYPEARTVIEMGGEDSKLILMEREPKAEKSQLVDFAMNSVCAAGTGSFLDQQAKRIGVSIESEFGELALKSESPPRIAGRCSVFAKSDMIHLQQIATPIEDIVAGLCFAVARNFKSCLARGKSLTPPVIFQGGVAANQGVVRAFREILELGAEELVIPDHHASMGALGAVFYILDHGTDGAKDFQGLEELELYLRSLQSEGSHLEPLQQPTISTHKNTYLGGNGKKIEVYLGLDVGSLSTNVVLIDKEDNVVARRYLPTAGKPLDAIRRGMSEIQYEVGDKVIVRGAGTTGSGRYLTGDFIGADTIQNEITAQATAAIAIDPTVDTIFEIGGQDSKYISIDDGVVVDFEMNKVCAAGTGSFLEEQAEKLDINIREEFENLALGADKPARLGDRCTVFMESDLNSHQQKGAEKENLIAGLAYSIAQNYIQKVVGNKRIGDRIFFQGGVTNNKSVVAAFEKITEKKINVPPHFDVTGAIGAAMLARETVKKGRETKFKGFDISRVPFSLEKFTCKACSNQCEIRKVIIEGEKKPLFYGGRCERWEIDDRKGRGKGIPNYFDERRSLLVGDYREEPRDGRTTIGIPQSLMLFYQQFPYWRSFFEELGFQVVLSRPTDRGIVTKSLEILTAETCFPVEVMHGHIDDLLAREVDYIFTPFVINSEAAADNPTINYNCPWVQTYPFMIHSAFKNDPREERFLVPTLQFRYGRKVLENQLTDFTKKKFGISRSKVAAAMSKAENAQNLFNLTVHERGEAALESLPADKTAAVILGRPYNSGDPELNLHLVEKLINLDVVPIPVDYLPLSGENIFDEYSMMYWPNGQNILAASRIVAREESLHAVYLGNFRCGPDSFLLHYVREEMKDKPFLQLEVDEHSADAGMITRCEAFLDSLRGYTKVHSRNEVESFSAHQAKKTRGERVIYFPYMCDHAHALAAAAKSCGVQAEVLPMQDERDIELGRKYTSSRECFPMICTTGSFLKKLEEPGFDPSKARFFMPSHNGPCRFGQYNKLQRIILDRLGYHDAEILSPRNDDSYAEIFADAGRGAGKGVGVRYRFLAYKGIVAVDLLRKLQQERRPYEAIAGETDRIYHEQLNLLKSCLEAGGKGLADVMSTAAEAFGGLAIKSGRRKPIVAVVGEIFMRDNPYCSGHLVERLENLGAETVIAPTREWISYSTYRYWRDSAWKRDAGGLIKSKIQQFFQDTATHKLEHRVVGMVDEETDVSLTDMLSYCSPYVHRHYDGDPPMALGAAAKLAAHGASGVANLLPFTCMPGTLIASVSSTFRRDYDNIPWVNVAFDGQDDSGIETRLQAFMHQAREYATKHSLDTLLEERFPAAVGVEV